MKTKTHTLSIVIGAFLSVLALNAIAGDTTCEEAKGRCATNGSNGYCSSSSVKWDDAACNYAQDTTTFTICDKKGDVKSNTRTLSSVAYHTPYTYLKNDNEIELQDIFSKNDCPAAVAVTPTVIPVVTTVTPTVITTSVHYADSGKRRGDSAHKTGAADSNTLSKRKVTVCHVPKGNPANRHTIHVSYSAWQAHKAHNASSAPGDSDKLGSCNAQVKETVVKKGSVVGKPAETVSVINPPAINTPPEITHTIKGCVGEYRKTLMRKIESFYEPVIVKDTVLDDADVATAVSQCLDNGDSSDSTKALDTTKPKSDSGNHNDSSNTKTDSGHHKAGGKGQGNDSVTVRKVAATRSGHAVSDSGRSDSGRIHYVSDSGRSDSGHVTAVKIVKSHNIKGCQNKDTTKRADSIKGYKGDSDKNHTRKGRTDSDRDDANKNFHKKLRTADSAVDLARNVKDPVHVTDSDLNNDKVFKKVKTCAGGKGGDSDKMDSSKISKKKGDSGKDKHKRQEVQGCADSNKVRDLRGALSDHKKEKHTATTPISLGDTAYNDVSVKAAVLDCLDPTKGGGTDDSPAPEVITEANLTSVSFEGATAVGGTTAPVVAAAASGTTPAVIASPTVTTGLVVTGGTVASTTAHPTSTTMTGGVITTTGGVVTGGTYSNGSTTGGVTTGGTVIGGSLTSGRLTTGLSNISGSVTGKDVSTGALGSGSAATGGTATGGTVTGGILTCPSGTVIVCGNTTGGTVSGAAIVEGAAAELGRTVTGSTNVCVVDTAFPVENCTVTSSTAANSTLTGASVSGASITGGSIAAPDVYTSGIVGGGSGRVGWREINEVK